MKNTIFKTILLTTTIGLSLNATAAYDVHDGTMTFVGYENKRCGIEVPDQNGIITMEVKDGVTVGKDINFDVVRNFSGEAFDVGIELVYSFNGSVQSYDTNDFDVSFSVAGKSPVTFETLAGSNDNKTLSIGNGDFTDNRSSVDVSIAQDSGTILDSGIHQIVLNYTISCPDPV